MDRQDLLTDERFATAVTRGANAEAVTATLDEIFASRTYDEWTAAFDREDVWWAPIATAPDVLADPQAAAAGAWVVMHGSASDGTSPYRLAASPVGFEGWVEHPGPVPKLGEHTEEVLGSL